MRHIWNVTLILALFAMVVITAMTAGYAKEKYLRQEQCINAVCDEPCDAIKKFKRHQGCLK